MEIPKRIKHTVALVATGAALFGAERYINSDHESYGLSFAGQVAVKDCFGSYEYSHLDSKVSVTPEDLKGKIDFKTPFDSELIPESSYTDVLYKDPETNELAKTTDYVGFPSPKSARLITFSLKNKNICYDKEHLYPWLEKKIFSAVVNNLVLLEAASENKNLDTIDFRLYKNETIATDFPEYREKTFENEKIGSYPGKLENHIIYPFSSNPEFTRTTEGVSTALRHETLHALTANSELTADSSGIKDKLFARRFADACKRLKNDAVLSGSKYMGQLFQKYKNIARVTKPDQAAAVNEVMKSIHTGNYSQLQKKYFDKYDSYDVLPTCELINPRVLIGHMLKIRGIDTLHVMEKNPGIGVMEWPAIYNNSSYNLLTEGSYVKDRSDSNIDSGLGHPYENWDELVASTLNVVLTYTEELHKRLEALPENRRKTFIDIIELSAQALKKANPKADKLNSIVAKNIEFIKNFKTD